MPADEKDSAATNRLLDLLRSQQTGKSTTEGNASGTVDANSDTETPEPVVEKPAAPPVGKISTSIVPDAIVDEVPPQPEASTPVSSDEIKAKLGKLGIQSEPANPVEPQSVETEDAVPQGTAAALMDAQEDLAPATEGSSEATLPQTEPAPLDNSGEEDTLGFDPEYFQLHKDVSPPNKALDILYEFSNWAFGIRRKITVQCTANSIRVLKLIASGNRNVVESMEEYRLPYTVDEQKITHRDDLLSHILDTFDPKLWKKDTMFGMYSSQIETLTKVFKAPPVKGKEMQELITWTAKKNLPFSSENINIDYQALESEKGELKKNIIIGVANNESITHLMEVYKKRKFDLQNVTTIPYLDWQTFHHCYPDRLRGCVAIVHMNRNETTITMIKSGKMEFNREMAVGVKDYHKALVQRVMVGNDAVNITDDMATDYLMRYGIPTDTEKDIPDTGISLYKISIFLRPVTERMTSEINRSLDYFKKQVADVECQEIYFTGPGASIPNLVSEFQSKLDRTVEHLNPLRQGDFEISPEMELDYQMIPAYVTNFALALKRSSGINLLPTERKQHFQFKIFNKLTLVLATILLPIYMILSYFSYSETEFMVGSVAKMNGQWQKLSEQSQEYFVMRADLEHLGNYWGFLGNDRINSENQIKFLKLISSEIPDNIKVTSLIFRPASSQEDGAIKQGTHVDRIAMSGFVQAHAGIADIQLTNFIMRLESLALFSKIEREVQGNPSSDDVRLFFTLKLSANIK